jgi:outer membrane cobalamin receptor
MGKVLVFLGLLWYGSLSAQELVLISGRITNEEGGPVGGASVALAGKAAVVSTNEQGSFELRLPAGKYRLTVTAIGYELLEVDIEAIPSSVLRLSLKRKVRQLQEVVVNQRPAAQEAREKVYALSVVDLKTIRHRNLDINRLLDGLPGIRVRESGGIGSRYDYSIHGLSGKSIRFYLDGIPIESAGGSAFLHQVPANALDRIEVYKGVVPIELTGDALGGAINLVTRKDIRNHLDVSYTYGSFNTHKASLAARFRKTNGFTGSLVASHTYSKNDYQVWGPTAEVADSNGRPITGKRYKRFNDDFHSTSLRSSIGFIQKKWADELLLDVLFTDMQKGIQTGRTMAFVYGDVRYKERVFMPSLRYTKKNLFTKGLNLGAWLALNYQEGQTIDTGSRKYNWAGQVIADVTGELNGIRAQKSRYRFTNHNSLAAINGSYAINSRHQLAFNYSLSHIRRKGDDAYGVAEWTIPFRYPQQMTRQTTGLSFQSTMLEGKWSNLLFVKHFSYQAQANIYDYNGTGNRELIKQKSRNSNWGAGYGTTYKQESWLIKLSFEQAIRLPDAEELLGDGNTILNAPGLQPERSTNLNAGLQKAMLFNQHQLTMELGLFYRDTRNLIWLGEGNLFGTARYENISSIRSTGGELSLSYTNKKWLEATMNATYQDVRNTQRITASGAPNIVYKDRMKNMPAVMANGELRFRYPSAFGGQGHAAMYVSAHFVEAFYLNWPSLGDRSTKKKIPEQLTQDAGITYSLRDNRYHISLECRNMFNRQVFDNYLLQKPGRFISATFRCYLYSTAK